MPSTQRTSVRLSVGAVGLLRELSRFLGLKRSAVIEYGLRRLARLGPQQPLARPAGAEEGGARADQPVSFGLSAEAAGLLAELRRALALRSDGAVIEAMLHHLAETEMRSAGGDGKPPDGQEGGQASEG